MDRRGFLSMAIWAAALPVAGAPVFAGGNSGPGGGGDDDNSGPGGGDDGNSGPGGADDDNSGPGGGDSLKAILKSLRRRYDGEIVNVERTANGYRIKLLEKSGRLRTVNVAGRRKRKG